MNRMGLFPKKYSDQEILSDIAERNDAILKWMYATYFPMIAKMILNNKGTIEEVEDLFQEAMIILIQKIRNGNCQVKESLYGYLRSICLYIWRDKLKKQHHRSSIPLDPDRLMDETDTVEIDEEYARLKKNKLLWIHFGLLKKDCQQILNFTFSKVPDAEIARIMGLKEKEEIIKRRSRCKFYLIQSVRSDPDYPELMLYE